MDAEKKNTFMQLYEPNHARFERFCKARVYGEMDFKDLMHDAVVIAYQKFDSLKDPSAFLSFLIGIAIRILANNKRKQKRSEKYVRDLSFHDFEDEQHVRKMDIDHLYAALSLLPAVQRETLILFEILGYSIREIADFHQAGESAVKQRLSRGRSSLKEILESSTNLEKTS